MKKILAILLILILGVSTAFASNANLFDSDKLSMEKFLNITNIYDCTLSDSFAAFINTSKLVKTVGFNDHGQLGNAVLDSSSTLTDVAGLTNIIKVAAGDDFIIALTQVGKVYAWGKNDRGQLGLGDTEDRKVPVAINSLSSVMDIAVGDNFAVAIKYDGSVWTWGANEFGQLGLGDKTDRLSPEKIQNFVSCAAAYAGNSHVAVLTGSAKMYVWGKNDYGQLTLGHTDEVLSPVNAADIQYATDYALGDDFTAIVKSSGLIYVCGKNDRGQLGLGHNETVTKLTSINSLRSVFAIDAGRNHMAAITSAGVGYAWGANDHGQLGTGDYTDSDIPVRIPFSSVKTEVKCGGYSTLFMTGAGPVYFAGNLVNSLTEPVVRPEKPASISDIGILIDNKWFITDVEPIIINGRTMLPMRAIFEEYGATLDWNDSSKTATATLGNTVVTVAIGGAVAYVNDQPKELDSPAVIVNSRTLVPVRFISEALGFTVDWDADERVVIINR